MNLWKCLRVWDFSEFIQQYLTDTNTKSFYKSGICLIIDVYTPPPIPSGFRVESYYSRQKYQESRRNDQEFFTSQYPLKVTIPDAS